MAERYSIAATKIHRKVTPRQAGATMSEAFEKFSMMADVGYRPTLQDSKQLG